MVPKTLPELEALIASKIEESAILEYKDGAAVDRSDNAKREITKDVSAFANSTGGTLIYGIAEFRDKQLKHLPERLAPVDTTVCNREWLDQIIGQIQPKVEGLTIHPVHKGPKATDYCFVLEIPKSTTAHQALDRCYYKRRNFLVEAMQDYEIRDVMNRSKHPRLSVGMVINAEQCRVDFRVKNESDVMARHFSVHVEFPAMIAGAPVLFSQPPGVLHLHDGLKYWCLEWNNVNGNPLFPSSEQHRVFNWSRPGYQDGAPKPLTEVKLKVHADNMPPQTFLMSIMAAQKSWIHSP